MFWWWLLGWSAEPPIAVEKLTKDYESKLQVLLL